jgi:hypothetical protein
MMRTAAANSLLYVLLRTKVRPAGSLESYLELSGIM